MRHLLHLSLLVYTTLTHAQVVLDGTVGPTGPLTGPNFQISVDLGRQEGGNLFHSFSQFDLNKEQTATFLGPETVQNIIGRVTGGDRSVINGVIRSEIPNANLYLLNPNGFVFDKYAKLDVQGSFHVSTAGQLRLGDAGTFDARYPERSVFVSAPPSAFGFLETSPAEIKINESNLATGSGKTLSFIGGEINIKGGLLRAISGRINLAAIVSADQLTTTSSGLQTSYNAQLGKIVLESNARIDVGKEGAGDIYIRGGQFILNQSEILANTSIDKRGGAIALDVEELHMSEGANIDSRTFGPGHGGQIIIKVAGQAQLSNHSTIQSSTQSSDLQAGDAGNIVLQARCLNLQGSTISTATEGPGQGGNITLSTFDYISLTPFASPTGQLSSSIQASSQPNEGKEANAGHAGRIDITTRDLHLSGEKTKIDNSTTGAGQGGSITLTLSHSLQIGDQAQISADSKGDGEAGNISIHTPHLDMHNGTVSTATNQADGGNIIIKSQAVELQNSELSATVSGGKGNGGNLLISNPKFFRLTNSRIIANASKGRGGLVLIVTHSPLQSQQSSITASSDQGLDGEVKIDNIYNVDLGTLPIVFLDAGGLIKKRCMARTDADLSSFVIVGKRGLPNAPDDLQSYTPK